MSNIRENGMAKKQAKKRGRPETRVLKIDASPEYVAKAIFAAGKMDKKDSKNRRNK